MKLVKYLVWLLLLISAIIFIQDFNDKNIIEGTNSPIVIIIPYLDDIPEYKDGFKAWIVLVITLTIGVIIGFILALFQILSQKSDIYALKSKLRRVQVELDSLRNENIDDDIELIDESEENSL